MQYYNRYCKMISNWSCSAQRLCHPLGLFHCVCQPENGKLVPHCIIISSHVLYLIYIFSIYVGYNSSDIASGSSGPSINTSHHPDSVTTSYGSATFLFIVAVSSSVLVLTSIALVFVFVYCRRVKVRSSTI